MTKQKLNKAIEKLASLMDSTVAQVTKDLNDKNSVRWYMLEEVAKSL